MKTTHRCPKCDHGVITHIRTCQVNDNRPMKIAVDEEHRFCGDLEAYVCQACSYVEFYVKGPLPAKGLLNARELRA